MNIQEALQFGKNQLESSPSPLLDCQVFLQHILNCDKTFLIFHREKILSTEEEKIYIDYINRRKTGLPVAYITGHKEFYGYDFLVTSDVLIPKPDTEILVEKAISIIKENLEQKRTLRICDMCTGSGCIGLSILKSCIEDFVSQNQIPEITFVDISEKALDMAKKNYVHLKLAKSPAKVDFIQSNLFENVAGTFDLIVTNPPYIPSTEAKELLTDGRSEPILALDGDINLDGSPTFKNDGLGIIRNLVPQAKTRLNKNGILLMETGEYNADDAKIIMEQNGFCDTQIFLDLEGQKRDVMGICLNGNPQ